MKRKIFSQTFIKPQNQTVAIMATVNLLQKTEPCPWQITTIEIRDNSSDKFFRIFLHLEVEE